MKAFQIIFPSIFSILCISIPLSNFSQSASQVKTDRTLLALADPIEFMEDKTEASPLNFYQVSSQIEYPPTAVDAGIEGMVLVRIWVNPNGSYHKHKVLSSPDPMLTESVEVVLAKLVFEPARHKGIPIASHTQLAFSFRSLD